MSFQRNPDDTLIRWFNPFFDIFRVFLSCSKTRHQSECSKKKKIKSLNYFDLLTDEKWMDFYELFPIVINDRSIELIRLFLTGMIDCEILAGSQH